MHLSVILAIRNEGKYIIGTLKSIIESNVDMEIIVSDGMSNDNTRDIVYELARSHSNITLIMNENKYMSHGFNRALTNAKGDYILMLGGHSRLTKNYINDALNIGYKIDTDCVSGIMQTASNGIFGSTISIAQISFFGVGGVKFRDASINDGSYVDTGVFGLYKREVFEKIGGLDEELIRNQDDEFNFRLIQNGGKIWLEPSIKSVYYPRNSLKKLFKQYFLYGFFKVRVMQKRRGVASWRHLVPGAFTLALLISIFTFPFSHLPFYLVFGSYLTANLLATIWEAFKLITHRKVLITGHHSPATAALLPITFLTLHFSYGSGFLCGLFYFWNKWHDRGVKDHHFDKKLFIKNTIRNN